MAPPHHTTPEQREFLDGYMADLIERQADSKLHLFWGPFFEVWVKRYPEQPALGLPLPNTPGAQKLTPEELTILGTAVATRKKKLDSWFRYHSKHVGRAQASANGNLARVNGSATPINALFGLNSVKRRRAHQPIEFFQKRNADAIRQALVDKGYNELNEEKMAEGVEDWANEPEASAAERKRATKAARMRLRGQVVKRMWEEVSAEELAAVEEEVVREKAEIIQEELAAENAAQQDERTLREYQQAIDALQKVYSELHKATYTASGWIGMTIIGGPNPRHDGDLSLKIFCFGESPAGNDFEDACVDFDQNIAEPFEAFLRTCFTAEQRVARAQPRNSSDVEPAVTVSRDTGSNETAPAEPPSKPKKPKRMVKPKNPKNAPATSSGSAIAPTASPATAPTTPTAPLPAPPPTVATLRVETRPSTDGDQREPLLEQYIGQNLITMDNTPDIAAAENHDTEHYEMSLFDLVSDDFPNSPMDEDADTLSTPESYGGPSGPSCPEVAAALAAAERGGLAATATMANIDPQLRDTPSLPETIPAPTYERPPPSNVQGRPITEVGGFFFASASVPTPATPVPGTAGVPGKSVNYPLSELFNAFRRPTTTVPLPAARPLPKPLGRRLTGSVSGGATRTAIIAASLIGAPMPALSTGSGGPTVSTSTSPTISGNTTRAATPTVATSTATAAISAISTSISSTILNNTTLTAVATSTATAAVTTSTSPTASGNATPTATSTVATSTPATPTPIILPTSRPYGNRPTLGKEKDTAEKEKDTGGETGGKGKGVPGRKATVAAQAAEKEAAAETAKKVANVIEVVKRRGRGRPKKIVEDGALTDTTNLPDLSSTDTADTANSVTSDPTPSDPAPDAARDAPVKRKRTATTLPDGSVPIRQVKNKRGDPGTTAQQATSVKQPAVATRKRKVDAARTTRSAAATKKARK
ncbi:hypothetical protein B0H16DRAFT_1481650 [Mycena metata]|uniref:Uncharacterized protein n=1 Tax=Mycena metata TaxID=1033252 RepID=A0AAD7GX35_9AGAR|nr:hypothetical protein B0H16DRAFT_1481650 [Mycena metata]